MGSTITPGQVDAIAHSIDIPKLAPAAAKALAPDVEYRLRELIQDAVKFARHSRRVKLTTEDVNNALRMRNVEPLYGFSGKDPAKYVKAAGFADLYCLEDPDVAVDQLIERPLPKAPMEVGVMAHWLLINGVQPLTPENAPLLSKVGAAAPAGAAAAGAGGSKRHKGQDSGARSAAGAAEEGGSKASQVQVQLPVQHVLPMELQLYFGKAMDVVQASLNARRAAPPAQTPNGPPAGESGAEAPAAQPPPQQPQYWGQLAPAVAGSSSKGGAAAGGEGGGEGGGGGGTETAAAAAADGLDPQQEAKLAAVLASLTTDPGLHPLTPYLVKFIADEVAASLHHTRSLALLLRLARSLVRNEHLGLDRYLHQLLPALLTCVVAAGIGAGSAGAAPGGVDAWGIRQDAAQLVAEVCARFGAVHLNVQPRVCKTLMRALLDPTKPLTSHYGAIIGIAALGPSTVRTLLLPQLPVYLARLQPLLSDEASPRPDSNGHGGPDAMDTDQGAGEGASAQQQQRQRQRADALRVHGALVEAAAGCLYELLVGKVAGELGQEEQQRLEAALRPGEAAVSKVAEAFRQQQQQPKLLTPEQQAEAAGGEDGDSDRARACAILAISWREDVPLPDVVWAAGELLGPAFTARLPQARPAHECL